MSLPTRFWADLPWPAFRELPPDTVAVLPIASIEQHGPHLPVSVDTTINGGVVARTLEKLAPDCPVLVLPTQPYGNSVEHLRYPGTLTLSPETCLALWTEVGRSVARAGVRRLLLLNSHGGNQQIMEVVCRRLRIECDMLAVACMWSRMGTPEGLLSAEERRYGIHAGQNETAVMLALAPHLVRMGRARHFRSAWAQAENVAPHMLPGGGAAPAWQAQDLHPAGAVGDAAAATAEDGERMLDFAAHRIAALIEEVRRFDADAWVGKEPDPDAP